MRRLLWRDGAGMIASGDRCMTLLAPPVFGFAFDALRVEGNDAELEHAGKRRTLTPVELAEVHARCAQLDAANDAARVHGVDAEGRYLGLVAEEACAHVLDGPPPFDAAEAVFDLQRREWRRALSTTRVSLEARAQRTALLTACDWTQSADSPLSAADRLAWRNYRQALRDLPTHPRWPQLEPAHWPTPPA
jgi:hypothetical protein